jgi:hypothetical protein
MKEPCNNCRKEKDNIKLTPPPITDNQSSFILKAIHLLDLPETENKSDLISHYYFWGGIEPNSFWKSLEKYKIDRKTIKKEKNYLYAIGLVWFYQNWVISKESFNVSSAYTILKSWDEKKSDMWVRILKWWISSSDDFLDDLVHYVTLILLNRDIPNPI